MIKNFVGAICLLFISVVAWAQVVIDVPQTSPEYSNVRFGFTSDAALVDISIYKVYSVKINNKDVEVLDAAIVEYLELKEPNKYSFTGPPGKYKITVSCYGTKIDKGFAYTTIGGNSPGPGPGPGPGPVPGPNLEGLALDIYKLGMAVQTDNRAAEAKLLSEQYENVAAKAAALSNMGPEAIVAELTSAMRSNIPADVKTKWNSFNVGYVDLMKTMPANKDAIIAAYLEVAKGLKECK